MLRKYSTIAFIFFISISFAQAQQQKNIDKSDWTNGYPDGCTTIAVGKLASFDGSVMTSHTDDSHRTRSNLTIVPAMQHERGELVTLYHRFHVYKV